MAASADSSFKGQRIGVASPLPTMTPTQLTTLLTYSPDALLLVNEHGVITYLNEQVATLFGYATDALLGQPIERLLPESLAATHRQHRIDYQEDPHARAMGQELDLRGRRQDGSEFLVDVSLRPIRFKKAVHVLAAIRDVTHQHRLERELTERTALLEDYLQLIDLAHDAIIVRDPISRILLWNQGAVDLYGYSAPDAIGRITHALLHTRFPIPLAQIEARLTREGFWEGELLHQAASGQQLVVASRQVLVHSANGSPQKILEINRDITQQRRIEQAQAQLHGTTVVDREFLQHIVEHLPNSVAVLRGPEARLVWINPAASDLWGAEWPVDMPLAQFLQGQRMRLLDEQSHRIPFEELSAMRALQGENVVQRQEILQLASGKRLPLLVEAFPLATHCWSENEEPLALVIHEDVQLLKETEYLKDEFIGIAAHELRSPLTILKGAISTLLIQTARGRGTALADWQQETLADMEPAVDRLTLLTEDLLDVTRLQAGRLILQPVMSDVVGLARRVQERMQQEMRGREIRIQAQAEQVEVHVDPGRIDQVLANLLGNALKYSPQGGVVQVHIESQEHQVRIQVEDEGIGIPRHQQAQIFGRFMRADNARASGIPGTGLGLYLCRMIIELHGGHIWFESTEGVGTTFFVDLPTTPA